jgi:diacylglycerol kinase family enzyme
MFQVFPLTYVASCSFPNEGQAFASVLNLISGRTRPMDLTRVRTQSGRTFYSFLSIGWGFLADCDIESERLRQVDPQHRGRILASMLWHVVLYLGKNYGT